MGLAKKEHLRQMLSNAEIAGRWQQMHGRPGSEADVEEMYRHVTPRQAELAGRLALPVPGLLECIATLRRMGIKIAGTTGYFREAADATAATACATATRPTPTLASMMYRPAGPRRG